MRGTTIKWLLLTTIFLELADFSVQAQRFLSDFDSSYFVRDTLRPVIKRFENLRITGYMQPQFQVASSQGAASYNGGTFSTYSQSRFMMRRARIKMDYLMTYGDKMPQALFSFQFDATERGVLVRDMFLKLFEGNKNLFNVTMGLFARPFGFEVNFSSSFRETPERGRMSQILMPTERDLGMMASFEPQKNSHPLRRIKFDIGLFNGQGLSGTTDFDSHKDLISRLYVKPNEKVNWQLSGGLSLLKGGWRNATKFVYQNKLDQQQQVYFAVDSSLSNLGSIAPRHYYGADVQLKWKHSWGETEWRAEYWRGKQPGTSRSTTNPGTLPTENGILAPTYLRSFDGAFLLFLQNIVNRKHQLMVKFDWYDPNTKAKGAQIGRTGSLLTTADVRYNTWGVGYSYQLNKSTRLIFYYDFVKNENTTLPGYTSDISDNIFTFRLQFRF